MLLFFNIGGSEIFIIVLVIIIFLGPKRIPELARALGKGMREIKNATNDIQQDIMSSTEDISKATDSLNMNKQLKDIIEKPLEKNKEANKEDINEQKVTVTDPKNSVTRNNSQKSKKK